MRRRTLATILIGLATSTDVCFAADAPRAPVGQYNSQIDTGLHVELNAQGEMLYYRRIDGVDKQIPQSEFQNSVDEVMTKALKVACKFSVVPSDVSASVGFFSVTWSLNEKICSKYKK